MPIKTNAMYHDPAMAQAAQNLASLFEPPSGSDAAGYALGSQRDQETAQRKALWDYYAQGGANFDPDRLGVVADLYDPTQSYYAVDTDAASKRYTADQALKGSEYSADTSARTSIANNAADNRRAALVAEHGNIGQGERR